MKGPLLVTQVNAREDFQFFAKALLASAKLAGWPGEYMVMSTGAGAPWPGVRWYECRYKIHPTYCAFNRMEVFTPAFHEWDQIIYVDADLLVLRDISSLTEYPGFAAVRDKNENWEPNMDFQLGGLPSPVSIERWKQSFNNGLFSFSPAAIPDGAFDTMLAWYHELHGRVKDEKGQDRGLFMYEQTLMNLYFYDKWKELPRIYNWLGHTDLILQVPDLHVLHMSGGRKWDACNQTVLRYYAGKFKELFT